VATAKETGEKTLAGIRLAHLLSSAQGTIIAPLSVAKDTAWPVRMQMERTLWAAFYVKFHHMMGQCVRNLRPTSFAGCVWKIWCF
jgi:hypothetical protein